MRVTGFIITVVGLISACSPANTDPEQPAEAPEPASAPAQMNTLPSQSLNGVDLSQPLSLIGTEPFWSITVSNSGIALKRPDYADVVLSATPFTVTGDTAELRHEDLKLLLTAMTCSDGMSDRAYPLTAQAVYKGKALQGCAVPTADLETNRP